MKKIIRIVILFLFISACSNSPEQSDIISDPSGNDPINDPPASSNGWILPSGSVTGAFNPFPLASNPTMFNLSEVNFMNDDDLVGIVSFNNEIRVYPYKYISRHESINDQIDDKLISFTYCPLTKSALCIKRDFEDEIFILRASGYLYKENVILHDQKSDTYWSQMLIKSVKGIHVRKKPETYNFIETTWETTKNYFNTALVFTNTSVSGSGNEGSSKPNEEQFSNKNSNDDINDFEKVYGIFNNRSDDSTQEIFTFRYGLFESPKIISQVIGTTNIIIVGDASKNYMTSYINDSSATFNYIQNEFPVIMEDDSGNKWNVFGIAVSGPRTGDQLESPNAFVALWWAWKSFYNDFVF